MRTLTRYVLLELGKWFLVSLAALTLIMVMFGVVREAVNRNLPPTQILLLIPYFLPNALRIAVPGTLLLAATSVYGRMSGSNEVLAIKSLGISPVALLRPMWVAAFLLSLVAVWLNDIADSWGRRGAQRVLVESVGEIAYRMLRADRQFSWSQFSINVRRVDGNELISPTVMIAGSGSAPDMTITAQSARLLTDPDGETLRLILRNGSVDVDGRFSARFSDTYERAISLKEASRSDPTKLSPSWLALHEIRRQTPMEAREIDEERRELAARAACQMLTGDFPALASPQWKTRAAGLLAKEDRLCRLRTEPQRRWSAGFGCLCFVWVGAPLAIWLRNRDFLTSFFLCFLPILVIYYPLLAFGIYAAKSGVLPAACVWANNLLLVFCGACLLRHVIRY